MKFTTEYTRVDFYEMNKLNYFSSPLKYYFPVLGLVLTGNAFFEPSFILMMLFGLLGLSMITYPYTWLRSISNHGFTKSPYSHDTYAWDIDENGIRAKNRYEDGNSAWSSFTHFGRSKKIILLYKSNNLGMIFPRRFLSAEQWDRLLELSTEKVGTKK